jgi:hypothetical protein
MKNSRDELMEEFNRILVATDGNPRPMTEEEYRELARGVYTSSGESTWEPDIGSEPDPSKLLTEPAVKEIEELKPEPEEEMEEPKPEPEEEIESPPGWPKKVKLPDGSTKVLRSPEEWRKIVREREGRPKPEPKPEYNDKEVMEMIKEDPADVVTNLMLQRKPEYRHLMYDVLKAFVDWITENDIPVEKDGIIQTEILYMLDELEREADQLEAKIGDKS